jgi:hypothetical protein
MKSVWTPSQWRTYSNKEENQKQASHLPLSGLKLDPMSDVLIVQFEVDPPFLDERRPMRSSFVLDEFWITSLNLPVGQSLAELYFPTVAMRGLDQEIQTERSIGVPSSVR